MDHFQPTDRKDKKQEERYPHNGDHRNLLPYSQMRNISVKASFAGFFYYLSLKFDFSICVSAKVHILYAKPWLNM